MIFVFTCSIWTEERGIPKPPALISIIEADAPFFVNHACKYSNATGTVIDEDLIGGDTRQRSTAAAII
jgi:hypothetical protein